MPSLSNIRTALVDTGVAFVLLAALFVPLEHAWRARNLGYRRPEMRTDLAYFVLQHALMLPVLLSFNAWLQLTAGPLAPRALTLALDRLPFAGQIAIGVVLGDLVLYWGHRASHHVPLMWRFHRVHHSVAHVDWIAAYREHPLDGLFSQLCLNLPAILLGIPLHVVAPLFVLRGAWATFVHSNVRIPLGPLGLLLGDPVLHRWHHAKGARHNYANVAPYLDVVFGTHYRPPDERYELGLDDGEPRHEGIARQIVLPLLPEGASDDRIRKPA